MKKKIISVAMVVLLLMCLNAFGTTAFASEALDGTDGYVASDGDAYAESIDENQYVTQTVEAETVRAKVVEIVDKVDDQIDMGGYYYTYSYQLVRLLVLEGPYSGQEMLAKFDTADTWGGGNAPRDLEKGDYVYAQFTTDNSGSITGTVVQFERSKALMWLGIIFLLALVFFGGKRGLRSIIALVITCIGLIFVMVPAMTNGMDPVLAAILGSLFSISVTLVIIYGFSIKTLASALGSAGGVIAAGILTAIMNSVMKMTGLVDEESMYLAQSVGDGRIDLRGILLAAILISVLGGSMDVGISIASALDELKANAPNITGAELMKSGINIGIDIMGASLNTLILAYVGGSIHLLMLFSTYDYSMVMIINDEMIASQLLQALTGSMGLLLTVPISSFVAALLMCKGNFGTLSPDCFVGVALCRRVIEKAKKLLSKHSTNKVSRQAQEEEIPENLYAAVQRHMENLEQVDADYFGGDIDEDGLYDELHENNSLSKS